VQQFELHLDIESPVSAVELLEQHCALSKNQIKIVMHKGAVWVTNVNKTVRLRRAKKQLIPGQTLHMYYNEQALSDEFMRPTLIEDCGEYSIWNKPSGMMSQGSKWGDHSTIARYAETTLQPQRTAFIVHRLDRATHGIILVAHSKKAVRLLTQLFEQRLITKKYQAVIVGELAQDREFTTDIEGRSAFTKVHPLNYHVSTGQSLLDIEIGSGRKHQIRRHLSEAGLAIVGDRLYGEPPEDSDINLQLCAYYLQYQCPLLEASKTIVITPQLIISN